MSTKGFILKIPECEFTRGVLGIFHKNETSRLTGVSISHDNGINDVSELHEEEFDLVFSHTWVDIGDEDGIRGRDGGILFLSGFHGSVKGQGQKLSLDFAVTKNLHGIIGFLFGSERNDG